MITFLTIICVNQKILSQNKNIEIKYERNPDKSVDIYYSKKLPGSYFIKLEFPILDNCYQSRKIEKVIKNSSGQIVKLKPINSEEHINFSYKLSSIRGNPNPKIDKEFIYILPFKIGKSIRIVESTSLEEKYFKAEKDLNWKSFIVDRVIADTVYSMRKGIVIDIIDEYKTDSLSGYDYTSKTNKIMIEHNDGTISRYRGFNRNSIFIKLGQTIYPQTKLGVLELFNNSIYRLYFDISYLKKVEFESNQKRTMSSESPMEHITPYFYSSKGPITLKNNNEYIVEYNETTYFKEFTKSETKKFKKNPQIFK